MSDYVKRSENEKYILEIWQDTDSESPRNTSNIGTMVCWHKRNCVGDKHDYSDVRQFLEELTMSLKLHDALIAKYKHLFKIETKEDYFIVKQGNTIVFDNPANKHSTKREYADFWIDDYIQTEYFENEVVRKRPYIKKE